MEVLNAIEALSKIRQPIVLAAGVFDGVHLGHQAVLRSAFESAARISGVPMAMTFDPHPASILRPESPLRLLTSTPSKLRLMERHGITRALVIPFDKEFSEIEAGEFLDRLCKAAPSLAGVCIGEGWRFGKGRLGDEQLLRATGMKNGFFTQVVSPVCVNGELVSSTLVREALAGADLVRVSAFLGRDFSISGTVVEGDGAGRKLGFPTANIPTLSGLAYPPDGVYAVSMDVSGRRCGGVANIGVRPTFQKSCARVLEVHLFDFSEDVYGASVEVFFKSFLRPEMRFENIKVLQKQIAHDAEVARGRMGLKAA